MVGQTEKNWEHLSVQQTVSHLVVLTVGSDMMKVVQLAGQMANCLDKHLVDLMAEKTVHYLANYSVVTTVERSVHWLAQKKAVQMVLLGKMTELPMDYRMENCLEQSMVHYLDHLKEYLLVDQKELWGYYWVVQMVHQMAR